MAKFTVEDAINNSLFQEKKNRDQTHKHKLQGSPQRTFFGNYKFGDQRRTLEESPKTYLQQETSLYDELLEINQRPDVRPEKKSGEETWLIARGRIACLIA